MSFFQHSQPARFGGVCFVLQSIYGEICIVCTGAAPRTAPAPWICLFINIQWLVKVILASIIAQLRASACSLSERARENNFSSVRNNSMFKRSFPRSEGNVCLIQSEFPLSFSEKVSFFPEVRFSRWLDRWFHPLNFDRERFCGWIGDWFCPDSPFAAKTPDPSVGHDLSREITPADDLCWSIIRTNEESLGSREHAGASSLSVP